MSEKLPLHPTLADVARIAGVGKATVSRVLNGAGKVSAGTLKRVNGVIAALNYQPSQAARSLKGDGTKAVGLVIPGIADPFFASSAEAAQRIVHARGYLLMIAVTNYDDQAEFDILQRLVRHRVEGILLAPGNIVNKKRSELINRFNVPLVAFNHPIREAAVASVISDNRGSAKRAVQHLLSHGYRRILCLGGEATLYTVRERIRGYNDAMKAAGLTSQVASEANEYPEIAAVLRAKLSSHSIDAIFAVRNHITAAAFEAMQELCVRVPQDVGLLGFDDFEMATVLRPAISVVEQPIEAMATRAAQLLFERLEKMGASSGSNTIEMKTRLILRQSCGCQAY